MASQDAQASSSLEISSSSLRMALSPQDIVALRFVEGGRALLEQAQFELAQERFEEAVAVAPQQPYGYYFLGRLAFVQGDHRQALAFLQKAELLFGTDDRAWRGEAACLRGAIYEELRDDHQARKAYRQCLELVPRNLRALSALARLQTEEFLPGDEYAPPASSADPWD
ncbi:MAG: tetratricopeptide repeat protein [Candidatus Binatia bacterium]|nr:tetratricopeptide repeat protein [Candidatus Binatia bacterium]